MSDRRAFLTFLAGSRIFGTGNDLLSHLYPVASLALMLVALSGPPVAMALTGALAVLVGLLVLFQAYVWTAAIP